MGAKFSKSSDFEVMENLNPVRCCRLIYSPKLDDNKVVNKWTIESTIEVNESVENTFFGVIGWKASLKSGGFCGIQVNSNLFLLFYL